MLNEVKHLGRERKVGIVPEGTYDGDPGAPGFAPLRMTIIIWQATERQYAAGLARAGSASGTAGLEGRRGWFGAAAGHQGLGQGA